MKKSIFFYFLFIAAIVNAQPPAVITANGPTSFCPGGNVTLTANAGAGYTYQWKKTGAVINGATAISYTAAANGNYRCVVTDGTGSSTSNMIQVTVFTAPSPNITGITSICQGSSTFLSANGIYTCYLWSNGATTQGISTGFAGTYYVTVCDNNGCTGSAGIAVTVSPNPTPGITGTTSICQGASGILTANSGYACYVWSNSSVTQSININTGGIYTVTVCDGNGCTGTASATVTVLPLPSAAMTGTATICAGQSTNITVVFGGGPGPYSFTYNPGGIVVNSANNPFVFSVAPTVTTNYTLIAMNNAFCVGSVSGNAVVTVHPLPTAAMSGNQSICSGNSTSITIVFTGNPPFVYSFTDGANNYGPFTTNTFSVNMPVSPMVTTTYMPFSVLDVNCTGTASGFAIVTVTSPNVAITANGSTTFCQGDSVLLSCNAGLSSYQWTRFNNPVSGATALSYWVKNQGDYRCAGTDASACTNTSNMINVSIPCLPVPPDESKIAGESNELSCLKKSFVVTDRLQLNCDVKSYRVFDTHGTLIIKKDIENSADHFNLDFAFYKSGIYFLELMLNDPENAAVKIKVLKL